MNKFIIPVLESFIFVLPYMNIIYVRLLLEKTAEGKAHKSTCNGYWKQPIFSFNISTATFCYLTWEDFWFI